MKPIRTIICRRGDFHNFNVFSCEIRRIRWLRSPHADPHTKAAATHALAASSILNSPHSRVSFSMIQEKQADLVIFAYSDVRHEYVMHKASAVLAAGADFQLMGLRSTQIKSSKPVVSVCAVRTGSGKSQTTRRVAPVLRGLGYTVAAVRHPMPYGDIVQQASSDSPPTRTWTSMPVPSRNARNTNRISIMG